MILKSGVGVCVTVLVTVGVGVSLGTTVVGVAEGISVDVAAPAGTVSSPSGERAVFVWATDVLAISSMDRELQPVITSMMIKNHINR